jgi:hypothetical protein
MAVRPELGLRGGASADCVQIVDSFNCGGLDGGGCPGLPIMVAAAGRRLVRSGSSFSGRAGPGLKRGGWSGPQEHHR